MKKFLRFLRVCLHIVLYVTFGSIFLTGLLRVGLLVFSDSRTYLLEEVPDAPVALVLGAGLNRDGTAGVVLRDRVETAAHLYFNGKVEKLLMSGDNTTEYYNEPAAMLEHALSLGIPEEDIILDYAGRRTYDSCYRAREIFGLNELIVVTQAFHLPRAVYLCSSFDIQTIGVPADDANYNRSSYVYWWVREIFASIKAYWDVLILHPEPILGKPEPIFIE
jgi:SanA protein